MFKIREPGLAIELIVQVPPDADGGRDGLQLIYVPDIDRPVIRDRGGRIGSIINVGYGR